MKRAVRTVIQIVAVALMIFGVLAIGLELAHHQVQVQHHVQPIQTNVWSYVVGGVLLLLAPVLFLGSNSLAEQLTDDYDDDDDDDAEEESQ